VRLVPVPCVFPRQGATCYHWQLERGGILTITLEENSPFAGAWHLSIGGHPRVPTDTELWDVATFLLPGVKLWEHDPAINPYVRHLMSVPSPDQGT